MKVFTDIEFVLSKVIKKMHFRSIKNSNIHSTVKISAGSQIVNSEIQKYTYTGYDCFIVDATIGKFCSLGSNIRIGGATHPIYWGSTSTVFCMEKQQIKKKFAKHNFNFSKHTYIGNDVWIADNVMIKSGVKISNGAVLGMGAIVTKDVGPYEIWAGNPAKLIKKRFNDEEIERLDKLCWWDMSENDIEELGSCINDIKCFLKKLEELRKK